MLDASKPPNRLFALAVSLLPRQVMLDNLHTAAAAATESANEKAMAKEEKEKSKKKHKAKTLEADGSGAPETLDLVRANGGAPLGQRGKGRELLLSSIASFLKINGFARTLATFRSEAQLENSDKTTSYINLEDLFCKFLESSESHTHASLELPKDKDIEKSSISTKTEGECIHDASEHTHRKKRKHKNGTDDGAETMETEQSILVPEGCSTGHTEVVSDKSLNGKEKKKKKHKLNSDMCDVDAEPKGDKKFQEIVEEKIQELKALTNDPSLSGESKAKHKSEKKKKKDKLTSEDAVGSEQLDQGASSDVRKISEENVDSLSGESKAKHKGEKKKKDKLASEDAVSSEQLDQGASSDVRKISEENVDSLSGESKAKHKGEKKKKKDKLASEDAVSFEQVDQGASSDVRKENVKDNVKISDIGKENIAVSEENADSFEKKSHKKRKRLASEERVPQAENENLTKKSKHAKLEGSEGNEETHTKLNKSLSDSDCKSLGKKGKTEENNETSCQALKVSPSAHDAHVECEGQKLADGNLDQSGKEGGASSNRKKKEKQSAEPKTVNAFQRVKVDEVKFTDERLQDNSYWALDDSGTGYGAKAQEILGAVKGRGFRHEKTKKKRGSYRGGQIDLQSHSIKFNYSDDE